MSVVYFNDHSITFIRSVDGATATSYKRSWYDFHLIPTKRPSIATPPPNLSLINIPGSNKRLDLTDSMPGGLTFGRRKGQWEFYVDTTKWGSFANAKNTIEDYLNGQYVYVVLEDDHSHYYIGRVSTSSWSVDGDYPTVTIDYDLYYTVNTNNFVYSLVPTLLRIESELKSNAPTFILGDPLNTVRPWILTTAYYDNDETSLVEVDRFGNNLIESFPSVTVPTKYDNKTSSVVITVMEGTAVGLDSVLKSGKNNQVWLGSNKSTLTGIYNFYKRYENGYTAKNYPVTIDPPTGQLTILGNQSIDVQSDNLTGDVDIFVKVVQSLTPSYISSGVPAYMWVGEYKNRLLYFLKATGTTNGGFTESYMYSDLYIEPNAFGGTGSISVNVSASNKGIGEYNDTVAGSISVPVFRRYSENYIIDSWDTVNEAIADGTYKTKFKLGYLIPFSIKDVYEGYAQIVAFDSDLDEDGDLIPISWILKDALKDPMKIHFLNYNSVPFISTDIYSYINSLDSVFPNIARDMLYSSLKEYSYYPFMNSESYTQNTSFMKIWLPSYYEITGISTIEKHDKNNYVVDYSNTVGLRNSTERIKYPCILNSSNYMYPIRWALRDPYNYLLLTHLINRSGNDSVSASYVDYNGNKDGCGSLYNEYNGIVLGFCTDSTIYDENIDWVIKKFKAVFSTFEYYNWDNFGLSDDSQRNNVRDAVAAELNRHVLKYEDVVVGNHNTPYITVRAMSNTTFQYNYKVDIFDYSDNSPLVNKFISRFNMTKDGSIGDPTADPWTWDVYCSMTTNTNKRDEDLSWVVEKFKNYAMALHPEWDPAWNTGDSVNDHVGINPPTTNVVPAVFASIKSETTTTYTYTINFVDETADSDFITAFIDKFNMTRGPMRKSGDVYIVACTMTTNKLVTE